MADETSIDAYPLSPMQQGMVFHTVSKPRSDVYVEQLACALHGPLDPAAFRAAWEILAARHSPLRTAFAWSGLPEPLQVVGPRVRLPLASSDWSELSPAAQAERLDSLRRDERRRGFDLSRAPLMRLALVTLSESEHRLIWTWHHAILDAWSVPILVEELFAILASLADGNDPALAPVRPYRDFIAWQRSLDEGESERFWRERLRGLAEPTPLGIGRELSADREGGYGLEFLEVPAAEVEAWRTAARTAGVTLNSLVQGAWALLLGRYSGRPEILFGTAVAGRPAELEGVESMVGLFINTLPVRVALDPSAPARQWLAELQEAAVAARRHEHSPLARIHGWSEMPRDRPLFESLLVFEDFDSHRTRPAGGGLSLGEVDFVERADIPLTVLMAVRERSELGVGFDRDRFEPSQMRRLLSHMRTLLGALAAGLDRPISQIDPVDSEERRLLLETWSRAPAPVPESCRLDDLSASRLFEAQALRSPHARAAVFHGPGGDEVLTYGELNSRSNRLARRLRKAGADRDTRVAICLEPSLDRLVALLAALKAGAAYVPFDSSLPAGLLAELIEDCAPCAIFAPAGLEGVPEGIERIDPVDRAEDEADCDLETAPGPGDDAYLIYTSGSTGRRKGVAVTHFSLRHLVEGQLHAFRIGAHSRILQFSSFGFDASVSEIFTALLSGACLYMAPREQLIPSAEMLALMERWRIDTVTLPPSVLARLPAGRLPSLSTLIVAGEPCPPELAARWATGRLFLNAYGPTEATVCATIGEVRPDGRKPGIGKPMGEARIYLLDDGFNPVPAGAPGHLHIGGPGVARGYWRRPELTEAAFVPDPFSRDPGARLYRTGDLARFRPDGSLDYLGRRDDQIKLRGFRVEPGEVEAVLRSDPAVGEAAVVAAEGPDGERRLAAFVTPAAAGGCGWWPSIAEFFVYDDLAYHAMTSDERRNRAYRAAIDAKVKDRVVLEIGTGPEALLSRFCAEAGARRIYAVEKLEESYLKAKAKVQALGLEDRIVVLLGDAATIELPEPAEACVSEIVGSIGGSEGAAAITNAARRLLAPGAAMIPERSLTLYAPVQLPDALLDRPGFDPLAARYVERIFAEIGGPFDLRLCVRGLGRGDLLAGPRPFEDLDYRGAVATDYRFASEFGIERAGRADGFLVWLTLDTGGGERIDILDHEHCWLPVFVPAFGGGVAVERGDRIEAACGGAPSGDGVHSDYFVEGRLLRGGGGEALGFRSELPHRVTGFRGSDFYRRFFAGGEIPRLEPLRPDEPALRARLGERLPAYMVPASIATLDSMPLGSSGKLDRRALLALAASAPEAAGAPRPPRDEAERLVAQVWREVLGVELLDRGSNFFERGGHSLLLLAVQDRLKAAGRTVEITDLFKYPTIEALARHLSSAPGEVPAAADAGRARADARREALSRRSRLAAETGA
ncbi:MAG TPA: amino acid adenylation domain-containing protein [Allosphingosinicella sp.]|jgi:amino acid adenylation domain-containing protein